MGIRPELVTELGRRGGRRGVCRYKTLRCSFIYGCSSVLFTISILIWVDFLHRFQWSPSIETKLMTTELSLDESIVISSGSSRPSDGDRNRSEAVKKWKTKLLLIGTRGAASCFLHCCFPKKQLIGSLILPEISTVQYLPMSSRPRYIHLHFWLI